MRSYHIQGNSVTENPSVDLAELRLPAAGFLWLSCLRSELEQQQAPLQALLQRLCGLQLVDLHISDLLNPQLPSRYDYTSLYDLLVFRRLAEAAPSNPAANTPKPPATRRGGPPVLRRIDTSPVGFVLLDQMLLTVHPEDGALRDSYARRLLAAGGNPGGSNGAAPDGHSTGARGVPSSPADLMLRIVSHTVDGFLALRRELSHQLDHWQTELINPKTRFGNWSTLLDARQALHQLDEICDDQRSAIQDWIEALKSWPESDDPQSRHARDLLQVRSRDVLEHIERVVHHVRQLEQNAETAVQIHFNAQSHRTNEIMRTLTVLTAVFLPLNLIAGIFGMNFEFIPLLHRSNGFWLAMGAMGLIAVGLVLYFWRKRYLERSAR
jgi:Mg2+ and Co2+ transporter CorA